MLNNKGFSVISVLAFLMVIFLMGVSLISMTVEDNHASVYQAKSIQAEAVAESGIEVGLVYLIRKDCDSSPECRCQDMTGASLFTDNNLDAGEFTLTADFYHAGSTISPVSTLSGAVNSDETVTQIGVTDTSEYAPYGRIMLGNEAVDYTETLAALFENAKRGMDQTSVTSHALGLAVFQNICTLTSTGTVDSVRRVVSVNVAMQDGWAVGDNGEDDNAVIYRYQDNKWVDYSSQGPEDADLYAVYIVSPVDVWAVGRDGSSGVMTRFNGISWSSVTIPSSKRLYDVYMTDSNSDGVADGGFAVGKQGALLKYNGSTWSTCSSPVSDDLLSIVMTSSTDGWIVTNDKNDPFLRYDSTKTCPWSVYSGSVPGGEIINSISFVSQNNGWAVGDDGVILRWNGTAWTADAQSETMTNDKLQSISMLDTDGDGTVDDGWIVGDDKEVAFRYISATDSWTEVTTGIDEHSDFVYMTSAAEGWIIDQDGNLGYWNGFEWSSMDGSEDDIELNDLAVITPDHRIVSWREIY